MLKTKGRRAEIPEDKRATEYLANERTFLAWARTGIALTTLGSVVARFGSVLPANEAHPQYSGSVSMLPVGIGLIAFGPLLVALAAWHYHLVNRSIDRGEVRPGRGLIILVTVAIVLLAAALTLYVIRT